MAACHSLENVMLSQPQRRSIWGGAYFAVNQYYVYIMSSHRGTLYTGVTNDLMRRVYEHRHKLVDGFTSRYNVSKLVYYETTKEVESAIAREKQIKGWLRSKKVNLIESLNPYWEDLAEAWSESPAPQTLRPSTKDSG